MLSDFEKAAISSYPNEAVAIMYDDKIHVVRNVSRNPEKSFKLPPRDLVKAMLSDTGIQAVLHSHPFPHKMPSTGDLAAQLKLGCTFGIVTTDGKRVTDFYQWGYHAKDSTILYRNGH